MTRDDDLIRRGDAVRVALGTCECQEAHEPHCETRGLGSPSVARALRALPAAAPSEADRAARELAEAVDALQRYDDTPLWRRAGSPASDSEHRSELNRMVREALARYREALRREGGDGE